MARCNGVMRCPKMDEGAVTWSQVPVITIRIATPSLSVVSIATIIPVRQTGRIITIIAVIRLKTPIIQVITIVGIRTFRTCSVVVLNGGESRCLVLLLNSGNSGCLVVVVYSGGSKEKI